MESPSLPVRVRLAAAAGNGKGLAVKQAALHTAGVRAVLLCLAQEPGGAKAAADVTAWVAARKATTSAEPPRCAEAHAAAVALADTDPPAVALLRAATARLLREPGGAQAFASFQAWVG